MIKWKLIKIPAISYFPGRVGCLIGFKIKTNSGQFQLKFPVWTELGNLAFSEWFLFVLYSLLLLLQLKNPTHGESVIVNYFFKKFGDLLCWFYVGVHHINGLQDIQLPEVQLPDTQLPRLSATKTLSYQDFQLPILPATKTFSYQDFIHMEHLDNPLSNVRRCWLAMLPHWEHITSSTVDMFHQLSKRTKVLP